MTVAVEPATDVAEPEEPEEDPREGLDPCAVCGSEQDKGPEGAHHAGFLHCWKCGYRPRQAVSAALVTPTVDTNKLVADLKKGIVEDIWELMKQNPGVMPQVNIPEVVGPSESGS